MKEPPVLEYEPPGPSPSRGDWARFAALIVLTIFDVVFSLGFSNAMYADAKSLAAPGHQDWEGFAFGIYGIPLLALGLLILTLATLAFAILQRVKPLRNYAMIAIFVAILTALVIPLLVYIRYEAV